MEREMKPFSSVQEPNLIEWKKAGSHGRLFTCCRPGRYTDGFCKERKEVPEEVIRRWAERMPKATAVYLVSLLGKKKDGYSEFSYYPFRSDKEKGGKPTFQEWLDQRYPSRFVVIEFPTIDATGIMPNIMKDTSIRLEELLARNETVVVIDSAGAERTARVCENIGYLKM